MSIVGLQHGGGLLHEIVAKLGNRDEAVRVRECSWSKNHND